MAVRPLITSLLRCCAFCAIDRTPPTSHVCADLCKVYSGTYPTLSNICPCKSNFALFISALCSVPPTLYETIGVRRHSLYTLSSHSCKASIVTANPTQFVRFIFQQNQLFVRRLRHHKTGCVLYLQILRQSLCSPMFSRRPRPTSISSPPRTTLPPPRPPSSSTVSPKVLLRCMHCRHTSLQA